jgi:hypothetical protein
VELRRIVALSPMLLVVYHVPDILFKLMHEYTILNGMGWDLSNRSGMFAHEFEGGMHGIEHTDFPTLTQLVIKPA